MCTYYYCLYHVGEGCGRVGGGVCHGLVWKSGPLACEEVSLPTESPQQPQAHKEGRKHPSQLHRGNAPFSLCPGRSVFFITKVLSTSVACLLSLICFCCLRSRTKLRERGSAQGRRTRTSRGRAAQRVLQETLTDPKQTKQTFLQGRGEQQEAGSWSVHLSAKRKLIPDNQPSWGLGTLGGVQGPSSGEALLLPVGPEVLAS